MTNILRHFPRNTRFIFIIFFLIQAYIRNGHTGIFSQYPLIMYKFILLKDIFNKTNCILFLRTVFLMNH